MSYIKLSDTYWLEVVADRLSSYILPAPSIASRLPGSSLETSSAASKEAHFGPASSPAMTLYYGDGA